MKKFLSIFMSAIFLFQFSTATLYAENNPNDEFQFKVLISRLKNDFNAGCLHLEEFTNDIKKFLDAHKNFDVNFVSDSEATPLKQAVLMSNKKLVDVLLENGADPLYEAYSLNKHSSLYFAKLFCKYNLFIKENPDIPKRFNIESIDPEIPQRSLEHCLKETSCNTIYEKLLAKFGGLDGLPPFAISELDWAIHENKIHLKEKPTYLDCFQKFKNEPIEKNWFSSRIDYKAINELLLQDNFLLEDMEALLNECGLKPNVPIKGDHPDAKTEGFYPDLIIYVVYMYHYTRFCKNDINIETSNRLHEIRIIFDQIATVLCQSVNKKCQIEKNYTYNKTGITYDYHGMHLNLIYPFTTKIYGISIKNSNIQNINIIVGQGNHSEHGVSISGALVMYFSCKNCLESVLLPDNPGIISLHIKRTAKDIPSCDDESIVNNGYQV